MTEKLKFELSTKEKQEKPETDLEKKFELRKQYQEQIQTLTETGLIELLPSGKMGFYDINGDERFVPEYKEILKLFEKNKELLDKKEGFDKLLIVPFGASLEILNDRLKDLLLKSDKETKFYIESSHVDERYELILDHNVVSEYKLGKADSEGEIIYYPKTFDIKIHGGKTKKEILKTKKEIPGYNVLLVSEYLPFSNYKETEKTAYEYLNEMVERKDEFIGEKGFTPEDHIVFTITFLKTKNKIIDQNYNGFNSMNIGAVFKDGTITIGGFDVEEYIDVFENDYERQFSYFIGSVIADWPAEQIYRRTAVLLNDE